MKYPKIIFITFFLLCFRYFPQASNSRVHVSSIRFQGNVTYNSDTLLSLMELRNPFLFWKTPFSKFKLDDDIEAITVFYRSRGFINPDITHNLQFDSARNNVHIDVIVEEGKRIKISSVTIKENPILDNRIVSFLNSRSGDPLIYPFVNNDSRIILDTLGNIGHLNASVKPVLEIDSTKYTAAIFFDINPGPRIFVQDIIVEGLSTVDKNVVFRELTFATGDTLTFKHIRESERNLFGTRMFNFVDITAEIRDSLSLISPVDTFIPVTISVDQAKYFSLDAGLRYGTYEQLFLSADLSYNNFFHRGHSIGLSGLLSGFEQYIELFYNYPWILNIPIDFIASTYYKRHDTLFFSIPLAYEGEFAGFSLAVGRTFNNILSFNIAFDYENVLRISIPNEDSLTEDVPTRNNRSLTAYLTYDKRNDFFNPTKGFLEQMTFRVAGLWGSGYNQFLKFTNSFHAYLKAGHFLITSGIITGWAQAYDQSESVPVQYQFFAGGPETVRGFPRDKLITTLSGEPSGGNIELIVHFFDIQFPVFWWFDGAVFLDGGYIWPDFKSIKISDLKLSAGPALRVQTPIGLIRFDLGLQLQTLGKENNYQIHLGIGKPF